MEVTPAEVTQAVTQTVSQGSRWALHHCQWGVLGTGSHKEERRREQIVSRLARGKGVMSQLSSL